MLNRIILLALCCGVFFAVSLRLSRHPQEDVSLLDLLPQETAIVVESKNLAAAYSRLQQGLFGKVIARDDFPAFVQRLHLSKRQETQLLATTHAFLELQNQKNLLEHLPAHSLIALIPPEPPQQITLADMGSRLVFLEHFEEKESPEVLFTQVFGSVLQKESSEFQGVQLTNLQFNRGKSISYFIHTDVLVWAFDESVLKPCIYQLLQDLIPIRAGVSKHKGYLQLKKLAVRTTETFVYLRMPALRNLLACFDANEINSLFPCPQELAFYASQSKKGRRYSLVALADQDDVAKFKKRNGLDDAVANAPIGRLSENTTFAFWTNWFHPQKFWEGVRQVDFAPLQVFMQWWAQDLHRLSGVSVQQFLSLFGGDLSLYIDQVKSQGQYPRSLVSSSLAVNDRQLLNRILGQLTQKIQKQDLESQGLAIVQFLLADGLLKPAYALGKKHLYLADSVGLIERMYDKMSLMSQRSRAGMSFYGQRSNFFLFLRTGDMVEWVLPVVTALRHEFGRHHGNSFDDWLLFQPLVQESIPDLAEIETTRIRGFIGEEELFLELSYTPKID